MERERLEKMKKKLEKEKSEKGDVAADKVLLRLWISTSLLCITVLFGLITRLRDELIACLLLLLANVCKFVPIIEIERGNNIKKAISYDILIDFDYSLVLARNGG